VVIQGVAGWQIRASLTTQGIAANHVLVTPTAFNTLVWRSVIMTPERYGEAYWSLLSPSRPLQVTWYPRHPELFDAFRGSWYAERVAWFSHGFYALREQDGETTIADLRMGEGDSYTFTFGLGSPQHPDARPQRLPYERPSLSAIFSSLGERL
jgi:inner membrane protein